MIGELCGDIPSCRRHLLCDQMVEFQDVEPAPVEQTPGVPLPSRRVDDSLTVRDSRGDRLTHPEAALIEGEEAHHRRPFFEHGHPRGRADATGCQGEAGRQEGVGEGGVGFLHPAPQRQLLRAETLWLYDRYFPYRAPAV